MTPTPRTRSAPIFRTAPAGRPPFRFTSFGDLATPNTAWVLSYGQSAYAVDAVESFQPLFHLLNGDLCYANLNPAAQPEVWRDFGNNNQTSAARRPWMPCPGNHEVEFGNGPQGFTSYLTRYTAAGQRRARFRRALVLASGSGRSLFVSLDADDVIYQDAGALVAGPAALVPAASTGQPADRAGHLALHPGATRAARRRRGWNGRWRPPGAMSRSTGSSSRCTSAPASSSATGNGSDLGIRQQWLPLFDRYQVDLVVTGTTTTTSGPSRCAAPTPTSAARPPPGPRSTPCARGR